VTMILSLITAGYALQISDRRLSLKTETNTIHGIRRPTSRSSFFATTG
jgi:hypothetical protein